MDHCTCLENKRGFPSREFESRPLRHAQRGDWDAQRPASKIMNKINLNDFSSTNAKIKYACAKQAIAISKDNPTKLYPDFDFFVKLLDSPNNILKWTAIQVIGNLSKVDGKEKIDELLSRILGFLKLGQLITANNAILALTAIACNKPKHSNKIIKELLGVKNYGFETSECKNIVIGKVLLAFDRLQDQIRDKKEALLFIEKQINNPRNATGKKARILSKKISKKSL